MKQTTNYAMHLPDVSDYVDIGVLDENTVKIDGELKKAETHRGEGASHVTPAEKGRWDGKAERQHSHPAADITGLDAAIAGKADKRVPAAAGNLAALDAAGNLADTGKKPGDFAPAGHTHSKIDVTDFAHTHPAGDIDSGELLLARGGTGAGTAAGARGNLDVWSKGECLTDDTCAMLGLPATATPNDAFGALPGFFPFQQVTAGTETEFGMEGNLKNGVFSKRFEVKGDVSVLYNSAQAGFSEMIETDTAGEFILIDSGSIQNVTYIKRLKLKDDFRVSVLRAYQLLNDGKSYMTTIIHTEVSEEYIAVSAQNDAPYQVLINRIKWNGTDFQKVGNAFTLASHGEVSQYRIANIEYSGTPNVYAIHSSEYRSQQSKFYYYLTAVKWNGTSFAIIGSELSPDNAANANADIYKAGAANEFVLPGYYNQSTGLHRVKWNGNSFSFIGNGFNVGAYTGLGTSVTKILQESAEEYTVFINYNSNNNDIARVRWDGAAFSLVGAPFHCNIYTEENNYAYEKIEYSSEPNKYCVIQRKNNGAVYGRSVFLDYILWDGNRFYRSGRKREAWFKYLEVYSATNIRVKNSKNLQLVLAQGKYSGSYVGVQAACVFINESNATALQTAAPNEKVWVVKE